ncbi:MAG TPA: ABC transporter ATP-binding protein [Anaerolineae bacterium]|nr:ABC transporter ATP-binding protein [Anaerolineae bacterium]HIP73354.1 ABC transporter ATP-binding protein [Anaerolineae bacterium]
MSELLSAASLRKSFGSVTAVRDINLHISTGEIVAIMGRSGSGKSTAMHLLAGLEQPSGGHVFYQGQDIAGLNEDTLALWRRENIGLIFQAFHLIPTLSALENVAFPLYPNGVSAAERRHRAAARLEMVGLADRATHRPSRLSGGEQQRVAIARALVNDPGLILADEPTGNLDSETGSDILALFHRLREEAGVSFLIVTHDNEVAATADRVIRMKDGEIINA